jgi:2'-5' RNA ligase
MHGIVSLLDKEHYDTVEKLWKELENKFGLEGIKVTPFPHFSWQVAEDYEWDLMAEKMKEISENSSPFIVKTAGLGIFSGESPIIFIGVIKDLNLIRQHSRIFNAIESIAREIVPFYHPNIWVPHISLAYTDVTENNIGTIMKFLAFRNFTWKIKIDNIALIYEPTGSIGQLKHKFKFSG